MTKDTKYLIQARKESEKLCKNKKGSIRKDKKGTFSNMMRNLNYITVLTLLQRIRNTEENVDKVKNQ